jgi:hypothetical protein
VERESMKPETSPTTSKGSRSQLASLRAAVAAVNRTPDSLRPILELSPRKLSERTVLGKTENQNSVRQFKDSTNDTNSPNEVLGDSCHTANPIAQATRTIPIAAKIPTSISQQLSRVRTVERAFYS